MNKLESPFAQTQELWSVEEKQTFNQAFTKAKFLQQKIDAEIKNILSTKIFQDRFPSFLEKIPHIITSLQTQSSVTPVEYIQIIERLKVENGITLEFAQQIRQTCESLNEKRGKLSPIATLKEYQSFVTDCQLYIDFYTAYLEFLERNKEHCCQKEIWKVLTETDDEKSIIPSFKEVTSACQEVIKVSRDKQSVDLRGRMSDLNCYEIFFTSLEKTVIILGESIANPQLHGTRSDNPLAVGMALSQSMVAKAQHQALQEVVAENKDEMETTVVKSLKATQKYLAGENEKMKFSAALEIINNQMISDVPLPVQLDMLCVCSRNSSEFPLYFKGLAMELAKNIEEFDLKKEEKERKDAIVMNDQCSIS